MTPHGIREDMGRLLNALKSRAGDYFDLDQWVKADALAARAVHFDFGTVFATAAHVAFADELLERGLFRLPFDVCLFSGQMSPRTGLLAVQSLDASGRIDRLSWYTAAPAIDRNGDAFNVPLAFSELLPEDEVTRTPCHISAGRVAWRSLTTTRHASRTTGRTWTDAEHGEASEKGLRLILAAVALLMSKDVAQRVEPAPSRLNKKRVAQGRPPVGERRLITIRLDRRDVFVNAEAEFSAAMRSSPRMHWRRGHFRNLPTGRVIPVAPSIVNANRESIPDPKSYRVEEAAKP